MIDFATGLINARHGTDEIARTDGADVRAILGVHVINEPTVNPSSAIPSQHVEIVVHRINRVMARGSLHRPTDITLTCGDVLVLKPNPDQ